jgi:uncharacterized membrane protein (DUF4010 family)
VALGAALVAVLVALAYRSERRAAAGRAADDPGLTTELALLVTYLVGVLAIAQPALAAAVAVVVAALLAARERLHRFATTLLSEAELHDALLLAALALVLLPLLPATPQPWLAGIAPRTVLLLLLLILLLQAAGHVALRLLGARTGAALAGLAAGFVSSTATIATLGAEVRGSPGAAAANAGRTAGAILSGVATWAQALAMLAALAPAAAAALAPAAWAGAALTLGVGLVALRQAPRARGAPGTHGADAPSRVPAPSDTGAPPHRTPRHADARGPLRLREAALVALGLTVVTVIVGWAQQQFGAAGRLAGTALAALADAHAAVAAQAALHAAGQIDAAAARDAALLAIGVNALSRSVVAFVAGGARYGAWVAGALLAGAAAAAAAAVAFR